jgi:hypothetical protein
MMKRLLIFISICMPAFHLQAQRYVSEIFTNADITITPNVDYASNYEFLAGPTSPTLTNLTMDVYAPSSAADPLPARPVIVYMHTGSYLPIIWNGTATGWKYDSTVVEMCMQFAKRGYVAIAMTYRLGWNPQATDQDVRTGSLFQAVYRSVQDAKACVRYIYRSAVSGNPYEVDTNAVILGGQGTGGYIAYAYATLDKTAELQLPKFLSSSNNPLYGFVAGQSFVNQNDLGDFDGYGGNASLNNPNNSNGYSTKINFMFNIGGALGDSSWLEAGDVPMVGFHVIGDPFAPYGNGPVLVPPAGSFVVNVSGTSVAIARASMLGNNNCFNQPPLFTDPYTVRANQLNNGVDGLFPFETNPTLMSGPWEWYDSTATVQLAQLMGLPASSGSQAYSNSVITNPNMSKAKAMAYIDTIQNYLNPRIVKCLGLATGLTENNIYISNVSAVPNPTHDKVTISLSGASEIIFSFELFSLAGQSMLKIDEINKSSVEFNRAQIPDGIYIAKIQTASGVASVKLVFN